MSTILLYVQHLMGIGHQRRMAALAREFCRRGHRLIYVSGGRPISSLSLDGCEFEQLPPAHVTDARYDRLLDEHDQPVDDTWRANRVRCLLQVYERTKPDVLLVESFPFARRMFSFELTELLERNRRSGAPALTFCSIRDILEPKTKPGRNEEVVERVQRWFDGVLMHADPALTELKDTFALADAVSDKLRYTGYVIDRLPDIHPQGEGAGEVLVSAGGGIVGEQLLRVAVQARALLPAHAPVWRCMVGPNLGRTVFDALVREAGDGLIVERNRPDFQQLLARAAASVSQAGYNTVFEALSAGCKLVLVPYVEEGETEQTRRSQLLQSGGLASVLAPENLTPERLAHAVSAALEQGPRRVPAVSFSGVERSVDVVLDALGRRDLRGPG